MRQTVAFLARRCSSRRATVSNFGRRCQSTRDRHPGATIHYPIPLTRLSITTQSAKESAEETLQQLLASKRTLYQEIWDAYMNLYEIAVRLPGSSISPKILQNVLRRCVPTWHNLRRSSSQRLPEKGERLRLEKPHPYENRLKTILQHMSDFGDGPREYDYNFVLAQMAAVGHVEGASKVIQQMTNSSNITPSSSSFVHALRACARSLEIPYPDDARQAVVSKATELTKQVMQQMSELKVGIETRQVELILRVFKEDLNVEGCEGIIRNAYGFDVHRPDRMSKEFEKRLKEADAHKAPLPVPLLFTTSMLTTLVDLYGRKGDIPTMISLFEVLTNPYPVPSNLPSPSSSWWDSDDEYDVANPVITTPLSHRPEYYWEPQRASPNCSTFAIMVRHLAAARRRALAQHYVLVAQDYDRAESIALKQQLEKLVKESSPEGVVSEEVSENPTKPIAPILAPRFLITPKLYMPVFGYANRSRILELVRWIHAQLLVLLKEREKDLAFYLNILEKNPSLAQPVQGTLVENSQGLRYEEYSGLNDGPLDRKPLDLAFHIQLIEESIRTIQQMQTRGKEVVARLSQRTKEKLTRRVWSDKDIYLRDVNARVIVGRDEWETMVNWKSWDGPVSSEQQTRLSRKTDMSGPRKGSIRMDERLAAFARSKDLTP